ncbi:AlbA-like protein [Dioscorea alata]|uniref:AlbA-like protein n=2 Tax=Dioscorea alata TaxID=55571 RepID=A0ACB7VCD5_DIOAL|nr:AlbA-like protein [Dioscorea alata]KAH7671233.1 AlbA-like protein [Dioscorea alata]
MDRYQRVEKTMPESAIDENEIRITAQGRIRNYITYAIALFQEKGSEEIVLKAMGRAINKVVVIAELIKRRIVGLYQNTTTGSIDITDSWEPLEEGLLPIETTRHVSVMAITLSKKELDSSSPGYQPPIPADQVKPVEESDYGESLPSGHGRGRGGRGRGRGRGASDEVMDDDVDGGWNEGHGYGYRGRGRGRGRGPRGRGFRGRARGYNGGYDGNIHHEPKEYNEYDDPEGPPQGQVRGRGRGRARGRGRGHEQPDA